ncbi:hypothetical protein WJU23_19455 [Prosthecobacter sp. SYSU 5D2]|uniref:hypothetical protein n=1 Tax=Prosthecobacter sp. SYSU 5D2 TaxID=3134134 RepID=UPI0031FEA304
MAAALIEVKLLELAQLFNSMDPSPFHERDLDHDAEEFIVSWAQEHPRHEDLLLVVHLPQALAGQDASPLSVQDSVRHYFAYRAEIHWREFRQLMREGRVSLAVGIGFLLLCQLGIWLVDPHVRGGGSSAQEVLPLSSWRHASSFFTEGLTIAGWVAMWRPIEIYLYRWWPLLSRRRLYQRLSRMSVEVRCSA